MLKNIMIGILMAAFVQLSTGRALSGEAEVKTQAKAETKTEVKAETKAKDKTFQEEIAELKRYNAQLEAKCKELHLKCGDLEQQLKNNTGLGKAVDNLNRERQILKDANLQLKEDLKKERAQNEALNAQLYQELGTAYTKAELYSYAIDAYTKALALNPRNAEVHYNLGLLYRHSKNNSRKAVQHLKRYLQLCPDAVNRKDVEYIIKMLSE